MSHGGYPAWTQPTRGRRSYHALADYLREQILSGEMQDGAALPNERDLGDQAGLSRGSVREALRVLEVEGFVSTKPGRNGGSSIRRPGAAGVSRSLSMFVRGHQVPFDAVLESREMLEPALAALAAVHRTSADVAEIAVASTRLVAAGKDTSAFLAANSHWHWAVAEASHNPVLVAFVAAIGEVLHKSNVGPFVSAEVRAAVIRAHRGIESAILLGDAAAARRRMTRHVGRYRQQVAAVAPETIVVATQGGEA